MKFTKLLMAILIVVPFLGACQADVEDLSDPRDAIKGLYRVTDNENQSYDVNIIKDNTDDTKQRIFIDNFHGEDGDGNLGQVSTSEMFSAKFIAGTNESVIQMEKRTISKGADEITIEEGSGTVYSSNVKSFTIKYKLAYGQDPGNWYTANFAEHNQNPAKKKKSAKAKKELQ